MRLTKSRNWLLAFSLVSTCFVFLGVRGIACDSKDGEELFGWEKLLAIEPERAYQDHDDKAEYWSELIVKLQDGFWRNYSRQEGEKQIRSLLNQFGKRGARTDLKICLAGTKLIFAQSNSKPAAGFAQDQDSDQDRARYRVCREVQNIICRIQVETFLKDSDTLDRYYEMLVWSQQYFGSAEFHGVAFNGKVGSLQAGLDPKSVDYWWYVRDLVLLMTTSQYLYQVE